MPYRSAQGEQHTCKVSKARTPCAGDGAWAVHGESGLRMPCTCHAWPVQQCPGSVRKGARTPCFSVTQISGRIFLSNSTLLNLKVRGVTETLFSRERWREPRFAPVPLTLAHLLLFHRRLDGYLHTTRAPVAPSRSDKDPMRIGANAERAAIGGD